MTAPARGATTSVAIIGGGPAGLMAAEVLGSAGIAVDLYDAMPSVGRKFLLAGKGGLNLTHSEDFDAFAARFGAARARVEPWLRAFGPNEVRAWAAGLGIETFVGSSGRVFPVEKKAAPLLRAWLRRLRALMPRSSSRWAAAVGRAWAPTAPGCLCWPSAVCPLRHCGRPIAASMRTGANTCARSMRARRSNRLR